MTPTPAPTEPTVERRAFEAWSIQVPATFEEVFVVEDGYWHTYDEHRSVSLSSVVISDMAGPLSAHRILEQATPLDGTPVDQMPPGLPGLATTSAAPQPAIASRILSGVLATRGPLLLVTVTGDDLEWAMRVWVSIRSHPAPLRSFTRQRKGATARRWAH
jgi:hypothetical protein